MPFGVVLDSVGYEVNFKSLHSFNSADSYAISVAVESQVLWDGRHVDRTKNQYTSVVV